MNWDFVETLAKTIGAIFGVAVAAHQIYKLGTRSLGARASLRVDLQILRLMDAADSGRSLLKSHIDRTILRLYSPPRLNYFRKLKLANYGFIVMWTTAFVALSIWTAHLVKAKSWWALLPGFFALGCLVHAGMAFDPKYPDMMRGKTAGPATDAAGGPPPSS